MLNCLIPWDIPRLTTQLNEHIKTKCKVEIINILRIQNISKYLKKDTTHMLLKLLALSHLDYANLLLTGLPASTIRMRQNVQNLAAKVTLGKQKSNSSTECLKTLHWLPIKYKIDYKICTLVFKCFHAMAPTYLTKLIKIKQQARQELRSADINNILDVPKMKRKTFALRAFSVYGLRIWNALPDSLRTSSNYDKFRTSKHISSYKHTLKLIVVKCPQMATFHGVLYQVCIIIIIGGFCL